MPGSLIGVEVGGTKVVAGIAEIGAGGPRLVDREVVVPTVDPPATVAAVVAGLRSLREFGNAAAAGIASFGPLDLGSGTILTTPKPGWSGFPIEAALAGELGGIPTGLDTDVDAAVIAETRWGAAANEPVAVYLTVGTGIGGGVAVDGRAVRGLLHPEMGHVRVPRHPEDRFAGCCSVHGDCLEGMASGPAIEARWHRRGEELPGEHAAWDIEAWYLAQGIAEIVLVVSPSAVVIGGGVGQRSGIHRKVAGRLEDALRGYVPAPRVTEPRFGNRAGLTGAFVLAEAAALR
jgi:fructokinase